MKKHLILFVALLFAISGWRDDPIAIRSVLGPILPSLKELLKIVVQAAGIIGRHVLVRVPAITDEFLDGFHADGMTIQTGIPLNVDRSHIPVACSDHVVGGVWICKLRDDRLAIGKLRRINEWVMDERVGLMALHALGLPGSCIGSVEGRRLINTGQLTD